MQPWTPPARYWSGDAFSILGRIGGDATPLIVVDSREKDPPFSILGRIGGDATDLGYLSRSLSLDAFSILGRIGGDATCAGGPAAHPPPELSVSSVGSEAMQLLLRSLWISLIKPYFQYPRSDRRRCNAAQDGEPGGGDELSVSSVGSEAMQRASARIRQAGGWRFQYPRSDRRRCNDPRPLCNFTAEITFSILGRIGGDATRPPGAACAAPVRFQYPRSDRRRCNDSPPSRGCGGLPPFSILGRIGGDATAPANYPTLLSQITFSILGRIGGDATSSAIDEYDIRSVAFQYPRSDRRRCNQE